MPLTISHVPWNPEAFYFNKSERFLNTLTTLKVLYFNLQIPTTLTLPVVEETNIFESIAKKDLETPPHVAASKFQLWFHMIWNTKPKDR